MSAKGKRSVAWVLVAFLAGLFLAGVLPSGFLPSWAQTSRNMMNLQGRLTDTEGSPTTGDHLFELRIFDNATGGTQLYQEAQIVTVNKGIYNVLVGEGYNSFDGSDPDSYAPAGGQTGGIPASVFNRDNLWLEIEIDEDNPLDPRTRVVSSAYAFNADTLDGKDSAAFLQAGGDASLADVQVNNLSFVGGGELDSAQMAKFGELTQAVTPTSLHKHGGGASVLHTSVGTHTSSADGGEGATYIAGPLTFVKERSDTDLVLYWFSNIRQINGSTYYNFYLNGTRATNTDGSYCRFGHHNSGNNNHRPSFQVCHVDNQPAGTYNFQIYRNDISGDNYDGWEHFQRFLMVQEIERY